MKAMTVRFRVDLGAGRGIGPGKIALLEAIADSGSLSSAARALGMSYRRAWQLLASLNSGFKEPVATAARGGRGGGGATLTPFGRELVRAYRAFDAELQRRAARSFVRIAHAVKETGTTSPAARGRSLRRRLRT